MFVVINNKIEVENSVYNKPNIIAKLYCGQPGTGKSTLLRKLYTEYQNRYQGQQQFSQVILCPTNQLISTYQSFQATTVYHLLKLTPKTIPSKHLKNFGPLYKDKIQIPTRIYIDEIFMFSYQEIWTLLKCIQIKQHIQKTLSSDQVIEIYMFGDPFQLKCTATSIAQQTNAKQGGDGMPIYWYHAFKDFDIDIETEYLQKLYRFDEAFGKYITSLKQTWREQILGQKSQKPKTKQQKLPFDVINIDSLKRYISQGYVVLVGTHRARTLYQQKIFQQFKNTIIYAKDGKKYRLNGPVYTISETGQSYQKRYTLSKYNTSNGEFTLTDDNQKTIIVKPKYKNKTSYQIAPGDVLTVNVVQGRELPGVIVDMQSLFEFGSFYTAISRCKKIQDIKLISVAQMQYPDLQNEFVLSELLQDDIQEDGILQDIPQQEEVQEDIIPEEKISQEEVSQEENSVI